MDEGMFTREAPKESSQKEKPRVHAEKLKNEDSAAESYRKKIRTGKKDNRVTKSEAKEAARLKKQGRRRIKNEAMVNARLHREISSANEDNNVAVDAVNDSAMVAEGGIYKMQSSGYSKKAHARGGGGKTTTSEAGSSTSKTIQKNAIKKEYQEYAFRKQAKEAANQVGSISKKFTDKAEDLVGRIGEWVVEHIADNPYILVIALVILLVILVLSGALTSCSAMGGGVQNVTIVTSFTADDNEIVAVEADYVALESDLQTTIDNIETNYPGYDEYNYTLAEISHNPYELAALLTVLYEDYTESEVQAMLQTIFNYQYTLDIESVTETRTRTETRTGYTWVSTGVVNGVETGYWDSYEYEVEVEYEYYILNVTLINNGISAALNALGLDEEQMQRYILLLETLGNKPDIFGDNPYARPGVSEEYQDYAIPGEYMTDAQFANMINEAKKYLGYPYVWGGSSPSTSFDCSGFVSYVINHCGNGWSYGRLTANGWKNSTARVAASDVHPGDLIFFKGTYNTSGASHVGIVVDPVNKIMIHCGNPIQYASYDTSYWRAHFYCYGRLP